MSKHSKREDKSKKDCHHHHDDDDEHSHHEHSHNSHHSHHEHSHHEHHECEKELRGPRGCPGPAGPIGPRGFPGTNGTNGTNGAIGPTGPAGSGSGSGSTGPTGPAGPTGDIGIAGPTGAAGTNGSNGATGAAGTNGSNGATGAAGTNGSNGATGAAGIAGPTGPAGGLIVFSTGIVLDGTAVSQAAPILMGFGSHTVEQIDGSGESTVPTEAAGFAFPIPYSGTLHHLQVSTDLLAVSTTNIMTGTYIFTVFTSPSTPNDGTNHTASPYVTTALTSFVTFTGIVGGATNYQSATNLNVGGTLTVSAGDRIGIRIRPADAATDTFAAHITSLSFSATLQFN